ncbi:MAG: hypothetical protein AAB658_12925, partial [Chloroflexota bacterium]
MEVGMARVGTPRAWRRSFWPEEGIEGLAAVVGAACARPHGLHYAHRNCSRDPHPSTSRRNCTAAPLR